ncbi:MAG: hypothetical protein EP330_27130 [Deltaproteobacteria bacterium]|nr:MAG: hypothetical protein EP330_27130 [Deltaproteobacteria bacterium]
MRIALVAVTLTVLLGCEHDEHPFEIPWTGSCTALDNPSVIARFSKDFWEDDAGNRRRYLGEVQVPLEADLFDSWMWEVRVNLRDETAETLDLVHVPIHEDFAAAYGLQDLGMDPATYAEDPNGAFAEMTGTCSWGGRSGELFLRQNDDCDACIECSTVGGLPSWWPLWPVLWLVQRRTRQSTTSRGSAR